jgi:sialate O-acetylesterase
MADVKLPSIFSDNMVLQANGNPKVFGTGTPGEQISISFAQHKHASRVDKSGHWEVFLGPLKTKESGELKIEGKNKIVFKNVVAGEVWFCAGQSNMAFPVSKCTEAQKLLAEKTNKDIRFYFVPPDMSNQPLTDVYSKWRECDKTQLPGDSAVAFMFAVNLQKVLNSPVGIIQSAYGGTSIKTWISKDVLSADQKLAEQLAVKPNSPPFFMRYELDKDWKERPLPGRSSQPIYQRFGQPLVPCTLFNTMVNPFLAYQVKGIAWYQGEADAEEALLYDKLFPAMILDLRRKWNQPNLPFLFVQLPNFEIDSYCKPSKDAWARFRDVQTHATKLPNTAMTVAIDQGEAHSLHPPNKTIVAKRLSAAALQLAYKKKGYESAGPSIAGIQREPHLLICKFKNAEGLRSKAGSPAGFEICGSDGKFVPASAVIKGKNVILSNSNVSTPVAARYAWANNPQDNVYNNYDLPAVPFNTNNGGN